VCVCVCVCSGVWKSLSEWIGAGGLVIIAACLASLATLILLLAVAVCLVRSRRRRRRRRKSLATPSPTAKIELQETPSAPRTHDPLLLEMRQLSDVTLTDFETEPVSYVVSDNRRIGVLYSFRSRNSIAGCYFFTYSL